MNIRVVLDSLAQKRPVFHNEADFQHALAWELRELFDCKIRLEQRMDIDPTRRTYLDILLEMGGRKAAVELKYKMRATDHIFDGETFSLLDQGAQDTGRYDVLKDLQRLEQMVKHHLVDEGYLIYLTNDASYYLDPGVEKLTADRDFRIHEGRKVTGRLTWGENTGIGTMKGRQDPIVLEGTYIMNWLPYSRLNATRAGSIQSLVVHVETESLKIATEIALKIEAKPSETCGPIVDLQFEQTRWTKQTEQSESSMAIASAIQSITSIPISQNDLRDKLGKILGTEGYRVQLNRDFGKSKIDVWAEKGNEQLAIEVRYKTALLRTIFNGNHIDLKNQAAQDQARYDFLKDIEKLEVTIASRPGAKGYAVLITNDRGYWERIKRAASVDEDFRIHQGREIHGRLSWKSASGGTMYNRVEAIPIKGRYLLNWQPYITLGTGKNEVFQMLIIEVTS